MAKKFKDYYGRETADILSSKIIDVFPEFERDKFVEDVIRMSEPLEFLARQDMYVVLFDTYLPQDYTSKISLFTRILGPELTTSEGMFTHGFWLWPIGRYVEKNAHLHNPDASLDFIYELTKRFTGEFAIRNLLKTYPQEVLGVLYQWSTDANVHVRRLASEGIRINLPWAKKLDLYESYRKECCSILQNLNCDKEKFVQKSVGNNLNDIYKNHPDLFEEIIHEWNASSSCKETMWIIKHGSRTFRKH
jgi:3-methyladenine DNA glycosylase AlkC